jgi:hypothetical protein
MPPKGIAAVLEVLLRAVVFVAPLLSWQATQNFLEITSGMLLFAGEDDREPAA